MAIKILRGNSTTRASSERVLEDGQPLYEKDTNKLYVGDGTTQAKNLPCITTDSSTLKCTGWTVWSEDTTQETVTATPSTVPDYYSSLNRSKAIVHAPEGKKIVSVIPIKPLANNKQTPDGIPLPGHCEGGVSADGTEGYVTEYHSGSSPSFQTFRFTINLKSEVPLNTVDECITWLYNKVK